MDRRQFLASAVGTAVAGALGTAGAANRFGFARGVGHAGGFPSQATFDYYISTTGADSNAGTLAAPWAISSLCMYTVNANNVANNAAIAGKTVGLLSGTYDIGPYIQLATTANYPGNPGYAPGLSIPMGSASASTVIQSVTPRGAILDGSSAYCHFTGYVSGTTLTVVSITSGSLYVGQAIYDPTGTLPFGTSGTFINSGSGSSWTLNNSGTVGSSSNPVSFVAIPNGAMLGTSDERSPNIGYTTVDGLVFQYPPGAHGVSFGGSNQTTGTPSISGIVVQNCEFLHMDFTYLIYGSNSQCIDLTGCIGAVIRNNYMYDFTGRIGASATSSDHLSATQQWNSGQTIYEYNTAIGPGLFGKEGGNYGTIIRYNYVDITGWSAANTIQDFCGLINTDSPYGYATEIYNNVLVGASDQRSTTGAGDFLPDVFKCYNNTYYVLNISGAVATADFIRVYTGNINFYNNVIQLAQSGTFFTCMNTDGPGVMDYNCYYSTVGYLYGYYTSDTQTGPASTTSTFSTWQALFSASVDTHTLNATNPLLASPGTAGSGASSYKLQSGSPCINAGRMGGVSSGSSVDMGAWGGIDVNTGEPVAQIGCSFGPT